MAKLWDWFRCTLLRRHQHDVVVVAGSDPVTEDAWTIEMKVCRRCGHIDTGP